MSANLTPPAFIRPPASTCDLITVGPPIRAAIWRASAGIGREAVVGDGDAGALDDLARLELEESHAARKPIRRRGRRRARRNEPVRLRQLRILAREHFREVDHHLALLPGGVVLHLAVDHVHAAPVGDRLDHLFGERDLVGIGRVDLLRDRDLAGVQRPGADAAEQERGAELGLAALGVRMSP